jgi:hypothetical protein
MNETRKLSKTEEAIQSALLLLSETDREFVMNEMAEIEPEQHKILAGIMESGHVQEGW